jgi:hypothetical protein
MFKQDFLLLPVQMKLYVCSLNLTDTKKGDCSSIFDDSSHSG